MLQKKLLAAAVAAIGFAAFPAMSQEVIFTEIDSAPPAMKVEVVPATRAGYYYVPGYWDYQNRSYVWVEGKFVPERKGYVYVAPRYEERDGRWRMYAGRWTSADEEHGGLRNKIAAKKDQVKAKIKGTSDTDAEEHGGLRNKLKDKD
jgi:YXWGXW repeat-containing protein